MRLATLAALAFMVGACSQQDFVADVPLRVVANSPAGGSVDAAREASITLTFSEKLQADSVAGAVKLEALGYPDAPAAPQPVEATVTYSDEPVPTVTVKPRAKLPYSTVFRVTVGTGLRRARDVGPLPVEVAYSFRTVHPPPLRVERLQPGESAQGVARGATVKVTFSEPVRCATLAGANAVLSETYDAHPHTAEGVGRDVAGTWQCQDVDAAQDATLEGTHCAANPALCEVTFQPADAGFLHRYSSHVRLALKGGAHADSPIASARATPYGGQLVRTVTGAWHVENPPPLTVVASAPGTAGNHVQRDTKLTLVFSEPIDCTTLRAGVVSVKQTYDAHPRLGARAGTTEEVPGTWACLTAAPAEHAPATCATAPDKCTAVFSPEAGFLFDYSSHVQLTLQGGAATSHDAAALDVVQSARATSHGGQLPATVDVSFHVVDPPALALVDVSPAHGATGVTRTPTLRFSFSEPIDCTTLRAGVVSVKQTYDGHPRLGARAGTTEDVPGTWSCLTAAPAERVPATCATAPEQCAAVFTPAPDFAFEYSTSVEVTLQGGAATPHNGAVLDVLQSARATSHGGQLPSTARLSFRVVDPPALALVGVSPADGATGVTRSPVVRLTFSEPPACASLSDALLVTTTSTLDAHPRLAARPSPHVLAGTWSCPAPSAAAPTLCRPGDAQDPCVATFSAQAAELPLEPSTHVAVSLRGGNYPDGLPLPAVTLVESARATTRGGELPSDALLEFRIEDPQPQRVVRTTPGEAATGVAIFPPPVIAVDLTEGVSCATVNASTVTTTVTLADGSAGAYVLDLACDEAQKQIRLVPRDPSAAYPYSATFTVRLAGGPFGEDAPAAWPLDAVESFEATTRAGQLVADHVFTFRTEDPPPMLVKQARPSPEGEGVALAAPVDVTFTESLDCASVTDATFAVTERFATLMDPSRAAPAPAPVACTFTCPAGGDVQAVRCDHAAFQPSSVISVVLTGGNTRADSIRSQASTATGGFLKAPAVAYSFRAADPAPLALVAHTPSGNPGINVSANTDVRLTFDRAVLCDTATSRVSLLDVTANALVPGTAVCTDGVTVGASVNGPTVIFTPTALLPVEHRYRVIADAGIVAADATRVGGTVFGQLPQPAQFEFIVTREDLEVVSTLPAGGTSFIPVGTPIALGFNQGLDVTSFKPCTGPSTPADCNIWVNVGTTADKAQAISLAFASYDNVNHVISFDPTDPAGAPNLQPDTTYVVKVLSGSAGPRGANGVSVLPTEYVWTFTTSTNALVASHTPAKDETGVDASAPVCVEFLNDVDVASLTAGGQPQLTLSYVDAFGRTAQLPLDAATPYTVTGVNGFTRNHVCLNLSEEPTACYPGKRRLLYATRYTATVSTQVVVGGRTLKADFSWGFDTRLPPAIGSVELKNAVINEGLADGGADVPVNAAFVVRFAEAMDPATLTAANLRVVAQGSSTPVTVALTPDDPASPRAVLLTVTPALDFLDTAAGKGTYTLELLGGSGGLTTQEGNPLQDDVRLRFTTSPVTQVAISPPESSITPVMFIPVNAVNRDLHLPSVTAATVFATFNGQRISGIIAQQVLQPRSVSYVANPTYLTGQASGYVIQTGPGLLDFRGNPVPAAQSRSYGTGNTPASNAVTPTTATASAVTPAPGATLDGNQSFLFTLPFTGKLSDRMLGTSYYASTATADGTVSLEARGGAGCPAAGTRLALRVEHVASTNAALGDTVRINVLGPTYMQRGCGYALKIHQARTANVYNQAAATAACNGSSATDIISTTCTVGQPSPGLFYTGETVPPALASLEVQRLNGTWVDISSATPTDVSGGTAIRATFSEPIAAGSVTSATFSLSGGVAGAYEVQERTVTFRPSAPLVAGTAYTVTLGAVTDLAGNGYTGSADTFTVETVAPTFDTVAWDATVTRDAPYGTVTLTFSEPVDAARLTNTTPAGPGSVSLETSSGPLFGCATRDPADPRRVLWRPAAPLAAGTAVSVSVNPALAATKLTDLAGTQVAETTLGFTP